MILQKVYHKLQEWIIILDADWGKETDAELVREEMIKLCGKIWMNRNEETELNSQETKTKDEANLKRLETEDNKSVTQLSQGNKTPDNINKIILQDKHDNIKKGCGIQIMKINGKDIHCGEEALGKIRYCNHCHEIQDSKSTQSESKDTNNELKEVMQKDYDLKGKDGEVGGKHE